MSTLKLIIITIFEHHHIYPLLFPITKRKHKSFSPPSFPFAVRVRERQCVCVSSIIKSRIILLLPTRFLRFSKTFSSMEILPLCLCAVIILLQTPTCFSQHNNTGSHLCRQEESQFLLQLKQQFPLQQENTRQWCPENVYKPTFWNRSSDCCQWSGVTCDESTGHVIDLDLSCSDLVGTLDSNSSLFFLTHLQKLNLAYNNLIGSEILVGFQRLSRLTHLNLSASGFGGHIPVEFYHLSKLVSLDLSSSLQDPTLECDINILLGNMTRLSVLVLQLVHISSELPANMSSFLTYLDLTQTGLRGELPATIFEKPDLRVLKLDLNGGLKGSLPSRLNRSNVNSIQELGLSMTSISGRLPENIGFLKSLNYMRIFGCEFSGPIPESIGNISKIIELNFAGNDFSGALPASISNLRQLTLLHLSDNRLQGEIPDAFTDLQRLTSLSLVGNNFTGRFPSSFTNMSQLESLDISSNSLTGPFPSTPGHGLQKLSAIDLSHNLIAGVIPPWLLRLPAVISLDLSSNRLTGKPGKLEGKMMFINLSYNQLYVDLESFSNLTEMGTLILSHNRLTDNFNEMVNFTLPNLSSLLLSSCDIKDFPEFLTNLTNLSWLDLSDNGIHGQIPRWFGSIPWQSLTSLNLSDNYLTHAENLPWKNLENIQNLDLHSNSIRGIFPWSICNMSHISFLDFSNNEWGGEIPECIGNLSSLWALDLRRNKFVGAIPPTFGATTNMLLNLGLNSNYFEGPLPRSLVNCSNLEVLDLGNNIINDSFPFWLDSLPQLKILILKSNRFYGSVTPLPLSNDSFSNLQIIDLSHNDLTGVLPENLFSSLLALKTPDDGQMTDLYMGNDFYQYSVTLSVKGQTVELTRVLKIFNTIDLSNNNFQGQIPESVASLNTLRLLNLSHNTISGDIPAALGRLTRLEQLDISNNQLAGPIPSTLTNLTFLSVLNLSHNHLVGRIPEGNQFSTFSNDSYIDNLGLCGVPLTTHCGNDQVPPSFDEEEEEITGFMRGFTWKAVLMGYGSGVLFGFVLGNVMISLGKPKWFARISSEEAAIWLERFKRRGYILGRRSSM